jgi:hypothetical protein
MEGIKAPLQDLLSKLATLQVLNQDLQTVSLYTRIFNNQIKKQQEGNIYSFALPAAFIEIVNNANYNRLGNGYSESDLVFRIYLAHWFTDAQDGTMEQDLLIYDLRDSVIALLSNYRPTGCGNLCLTSEQQDYEHNDVYVYVLEFTTGYIDTTGSIIYQNSNSPLGLNDTYS